MCLFSVGLCGWRVHDTLGVLFFPWHSFAFFHVSMSLRLQHLPILATETAPRGYIIFDSCQILDNVPLVELHVG